MKKFFLMVMLAVSYCAYSQEIKDQKDLKSFMDSLTPEQKDSIEVLKTLVQESMEESLKSQQVYSIGGIPFGISRDDALSRLKNKYGEPNTIRKVLYLHLSILSTPGVILALFISFLSQMELRAI